MMLSRALARRVPTGTMAPVTCDASRRVRRPRRSPHLDNGAPEDPLERGFRASGLAAGPPAPYTPIKEELMGDKTPKRPPKPKKPKTPTAATRWTRNSTTPGTADPSAV